MVLQDRAIVVVMVMVDGCGQATGPSINPVLQRKARKITVGGDLVLPCHIREYIVFNFTDCKPIVSFRQVVKDHS